MTDHPDELLPALSLGCLDRDEERQVLLHLADCARCRAELQRYDAVTTNLLHATQPAEPPPTLRRRLLQTIRTPYPDGGLTAWLGRWPRLLPAAGLMALLLAGLIVLSDRVLLPRPGADIASTLQTFHLRGTGPTPQAGATLVIGAGGNRALLLVHDLSPLDPDRQYQLWLIRDGQRSNGGVFSVDADGTARLEITAAAPLTTYSAFGVTIEPYGGSPGPTGAKVLGGSTAI